MGLVGIALARRAAEVFKSRAGAYPDGIGIQDLESELRMAGVHIEGDDPEVVLRSALNSSQTHGVWVPVEGYLWALGSGLPSKTDGLTGRALADELYRFVEVRWPSHLFHYEVAREALERTGVKVKGTGTTTLNALRGSPERFEADPIHRGWWRWK
jgi:hypothetical protein